MPNDRWSWDATTTLEALGAADVVLWLWEPEKDRLRLTGASRALGLGPLAPECSSAALRALALPPDRALAEDIRNIKRVKDAMAGGKPLPMALRENRIWGPKERLMERLLPRVSDARAAELLQSAHAVDGIVKGLPSEGWPRDSWQALRQLAMQLAQAGR